MPDHCEKLLDYVRALEVRDNQSRGDQVLSILAEMGIKPVIQTCRWPAIRNIIVDFSADSPEKRFAVLGALRCGERQPWRK